MLMLKEPVKVIESDLYSVVLEDADGANHYWLLNGQYDGHCHNDPSGASNELIAPKQPDLDVDKEYK